jgi:hypothetical protein
VNQSDVNSAWNFASTANKLALGILLMQLSYRVIVMLYIFQEVLLYADVTGIFMRKIVTSS